MVRRVREICYIYRVRRKTIVGTLLACVKDFDERLARCGRFASGDLQLWRFNDRPRAHRYRDNVWGGFKRGVCFLLKRIHTVFGLKGGSLFFFFFGCFFFITIVPVIRACSLPQKMDLDQKIL